MTSAPFAFLNSGAAVGAAIGHTGTDSDMGSPLDLIEGIKLVVDTGDEAQARELLSGLEPGTRA